MSVIVSSSSEKIEAKSSSSVEQEESSSSQEVESSSSIEPEESSSSVKEESSSSSVVIYGTFKDIRDGQVYKTVKIGTQTWMAENLNYSDSVRTPSLKERSWCYDNSADSCAKYGRLYTWAAAIDSVALALEGLTCGNGKTCTFPGKVKGICPEGWHLPTNAEWDILEIFIVENQGVSTGVVGTYLKSPVGWKAYDGIPAGKDTYGFSALPAGFRDNYGYFDYARYGAHFWSATVYISNAYYRGLYYFDENFGSYDNYKINAYSVRCLKD